MDRRIRLALLAALAGAACSRHADAPRRPRPQRVVESGPPAPPPCCYERRADGALVLDRVPVSCGELEGTATFLEKEAQALVEIELANPTDHVLYWVSDWPGCHWSGRSRFVWADGRAPYHELGGSVGCNWFEDSRPPNTAEIAAARVEPGAKAPLWRASCSAPGPTPEDLEPTTDGSARFRSWEFDDSIVWPMSSPPDSLPDGWEKRRVELSWGVTPGPSLRLAGESFH